MASSYRMKSGASTRVIVASSFTRTWSDGPAVSLNGSPTVSPTTAAAWASEPLPRTLPFVVLEVARLDVLLGVVPRPAAVVEDGREEDAGDRPDHQHAGHRLEAEDDPDGDRRDDRDETRGDHLAQRGLGRDVDDAGVVRALGVVHDPGHLAELAADLDDDRLGRRADRADRERAEEVDEHRREQRRDEDVDVGQVDRVRGARRRARRPRCGGPGSG